MSQVIFHDGDLEVMGGWDRPMGWFFLCIFNGAGDPVYSNLRHGDPKELGRDTSAFRQVLTARGVTPPEGFWERVERKESNAVHRYENGAWS